MKELSRYFKGYLKETILGPLFKLLEAFFELLVPIIIAQIVDSIIPKGDKGQLYLMIGLLFLLAAVGIVVAITAQYFSSKAAVGFDRQLTQDLFAKIMSLSKADRDELTTSSLVTRLSSDSYQIQTGINLFLRLFLRAPIIVFGAIIMAFTISSSITTWFLIMVCVLFAIVFIMSRLLNPIYQVIRQLTDKVVKMTREQMQGVRVIRAFNQVVMEEKHFDDLNQTYTDWQIKAGNLSSLVTPLTYLVVNVTLIIVIYQGSLQVQSSNLSQGMLIALVNYLLQILAELLKMTLLVTSLNQSFISARRINQVFDKHSENIKEALEEIYSDDKALLVRDLSFTYPGAAQPALTQVNFDMPEGTFLGVIGGTGSGKSTLVDLLIHLYSPQQGSLAIFHEKRSPKTIEEWRSWVGLVPQKAELFKGSIRSNLTLGKEREVTDQELWEALEIAQAADFVREKAGQLDEEVEAFGRNFSGGQRQRLTIARALLDRRPFLILDDSTSALDYLTEARLLTAIKEKMSHVNLIMISQRTNSLKAADKILLLDKGKQLGFDNHVNLLRDSQLYQSIHYSQHSKEDSDEA